MMNKNTSIASERLLARIDYLEENRRLVQHALEMALSLGDFQKNINCAYGPEQVLEEAEKRIRWLIPFDSCAFYLVDQEKSDFSLVICEPADERQYLEDQVDYLINEGLFAWAIREKRGVTIASHDHSKQLLLHVIATYSRIRGMFVGRLPDKKNMIPDKSLTLLSIILLNTANALESLEFYRLLRDQNLLLEKKVAERSKALAESERQLQQVMKLQAIGTLAGGIAHDFNNILFPIIGYTELTLEEVPDDSQAEQNLREVLKATNRAKELVQQILTFSRRSSQERKPLRIQPLISEALQLLRAAIPSSIEIKDRVEEACGQIRGDPSQIHQVIMNLCTNAYHAMQESGGTMEIELREVDINYEKTVERAGMKMGRHLELTVRDSGHGMQPEVLERIFEPYYTTKEPGKGSGLGLSVIHGVVRNHGGDICVSSRPGKGSTFTVYLPIIDGIEVETEKGATVAARKGNERILLIDDDKQIIAVAQQILEGLGYQITAKTDGREALEEFAALPDNFDLVITDMTMPKINGDQLARKIMDIKPDIPVILCTGFNETITEEKALAMGVAKFIMKPLVKDELANMIRSVLDTPKAMVPQN